MCNFMAIYYSNTTFLFFFCHLEFKYQKVVKVNLLTFFAYVTKMLKNMRFKAILHTDFNYNAFRNIFKKN